LDRAQLPGQVRELDYRQSTSALSYKISQHFLLFVSILSCSETPRLHGQLDWPAAIILAFEMFNRTTLRKFIAPRPQARKVKHLLNFSEPWRTLRLCASHSCFRLYCSELVHKFHICLVRMSEGCFSADDGWLQDDLRKPGATTGLGCNVTVMDVGGWRFRYEMNQFRKIGAINYVLDDGSAGMFAGPVGRFVERHPTVKMLALSFLLLIGMTLLDEGWGQHIPKGYIYSAMAFSVFVEMLNLRAKKAKGSPVKFHQPYIET
jgi:hypothetical protein